MKPFLLMDKSSIQGLSFTHFELIDSYYAHVISPILLRELISDLAKEDKSRSDEDLKNTVRQLSARMKTPFSYFLPDAFKMACNNLLGVFIPMDSRLPLEHGIPLDVEGLGKGIFFDEPQEAQLLRRLADGIITKEDLQKAKEIRDTDLGVNLETLCRDASQDLASLPKFKSLEEMVVWVDRVHFSPENPAQLILNATYHFFPEDQVKTADRAEIVLRRWKQLGCPELKEFAPYALHFYRVDMIHFLSIYYGFIKRGKDSKPHLDAQYLYYLPFCYVFSSGDKDLLKLVPFFLRRNQECISKGDFQTDLKELTTYISGLTEEQKMDYQKFGSYPPDLQDSFTSRIWKKFMRPHSQRLESQKSDPEEEKKILKIMKLIRETAEKQQRKPNASH